MASSSSSTGWQAYMTGGGSGPTLKEGDRVPDVGTLQVVRSGDAKADAETVSSSDLFRGKRVVLVGMPGAFTPVCTTKHLPGYLSKLDALKRAGVDEVYVLAVNDAFVMRSWGDSLGCLGKITLVADGNLALTRALGLTVDLSDKGLGVRSQRYAAIIDDGRLVRLCVEPQSNSLETAGVEHILELLQQQQQGGGQREGKDGESSSGKLGLGLGQSQKQQQSQQQSSH
jgi:peroxiredoxin